MPTHWKISSMIFNEPASSNNSVVGISVRIQRHLISNFFCLLQNYLIVFLLRFRGYFNHKYCLHHFSAWVSMILFLIQWCFLIALINVIVYKYVFIDTWRLHLLIGILDLPRSHWRRASSFSIGSKPERKYQNFWPLFFQLLWQNFKFTSKHFRK